MNNKYLIIGATGAIGFAFTKAIQEAGETATLLVRDRISTIEKLGDLTGLTIVEGDANDTALLQNIASGVSFIFHGANVSYEHWATAMPIMTRSIIDAAEHASATIIFPGNNYNYGQIDQPISEITPFNPNSNVGEVRVKLERMLQLATDQGRIRTLVVRMSEIWGPSVANKQFAPIFENAPIGKAMPWMISTKVPQQLLYAPDAGRAIALLTNRDDLKPYEVFNIGGTQVKSIESWLQEIGNVAGKPAKISVMPKAMISILSHFIPVLKEIKSMAYKFETTIILNDDRFSALYPDFRQTPMRQAITETLAWFTKNGKDSKKNRAIRRASKVDGLVKFTVDNIAIGVFPAVIALIAAGVPMLDGFAMYLAVAAGIYWTPALHILTGKLRSGILKA